MTSKLRRVADALGDSGLNALVLLPGANLYYTLGIDQMLRKRPILSVVFPGASLAASLPLLELPDFQARWPEAEVTTWTDADGPETAANRLGASIRERSGTSRPRIAAEHLTLRLFERDLLLAGLPGTDVEPAEKMLDALRMVKDPEDVEAMRQACRIAEESLAQVLGRFRTGMTEQEIANALKIEMLRLGTEALPKEPVVSSGPRTAVPHTKSSDRPVTAGGALMIDTGARYHGYCSDITRTFFVGPPPRQFAEIYGLELAVNRQVLAAIRAGVLLSRLDELAHRLVEDAGYGQCFPHRVGHGLGLEGHESPSVVTGNSTLAAPGLTFSVEPGIFIQGFGGVRVEENVAVTPDVVDVLTTYPRELQVL